jgi:hypothetical protein
MVYAAKGVISVTVTNIDMSVDGNTIMLMPSASDLALFLLSIFLPLIVDLQRHLRL